MAGRPKTREKIKRAIRNDQAGERTNGPRYTDEERAAKLLKNRDDSLDWWCDLAEARVSSGIGTAQDSYLKAVTALTTLQAGTEGQSGITISIAGVDLSKIEDGSSSS